MIALDTNVLIYACDKADAHRQQRALDVISDAADGVLLWQVACEFVAASRKLVDQGFTPADAWARLADYLEVFPLLLPVPAVLDKARLLHSEQRWSFWDAMIVAACQEQGITRLYSEDLPGHQVDTPEIVNPFA